MQPPKRTVNYDLFSELIAKAPQQADGFTVSPHMCRFTALSHKKSEDTTWFWETVIDIFLYFLTFYSIKKS